MHHPSVRPLASLVLGLAAAAPVLSQSEGAVAPAQGDEDPTLVVTARKFEEPLTDVPGSVTSVDGDELDAPGAGTVRDATARVPNMVMTEFSSRRLSFPFIRGIGSGIGEPAVVTYLDGVPQLTVGSTNLPVVDLERMEVLRGPQGTLYGRNALGGVIHLLSERPAAEPEGSLGIGFGNHGFQEIHGRFSGPISDSGAGATVSLLSRERDGFTVNDFTGNEVDSRDSLFGRAQLFLAPTPDSELRIALHGEDADDGGFVLAPLDGLRSNPHHMNQDFEGRVERHVFAPSIHYSLFGDSLDFTSITSFTRWDVNETADFDFTNIDGVRRDTREEQDFVYQELRLASPSDDEGLRWLVGASAFNSESCRFAANDFRPGGVGIFFPPFQQGVDTNDGDFDDFGFGVFGQVVVPVGESVEVTAGVRYDREDKEADIDHTFVTGGFTAVDESRSFDDEFDEVSPMGSVLWHATEDTSVYVRAARGFKAGGFNLTAPSGQFFFEPETSWTYEAGLRHAVDDDVQVGVTVFYVDWDDMQLSQFDPAAGGYVTNAGQSTSRGVELELAAALAEGWHGYATAGYTDSEFDEFVDSFGMDDAGNDLPFAPEHTFALGVQHTREWSRTATVRVRAEYQRVGDFYYDPSNLSEESYGLVHLSLGVDARSWTVELFARNLLDEEYVPVAFQANPADPTFFVGENAAPRTYGVSLRYSF